jgi:DNA repair protein RecO (recombination protein O)
VKSIFAAAACRWRRIIMPTYRDRGIVLKIRPVRDADRYYTIFTENHGKISVLAKGSRRGRSKMSSHLAGFGVVDLMIARGRLIDRLAGASLSRSFNGILDSLSQTSLAQSLLLAVDDLTRRELPEERVFRLLSSFLETLGKAGTLEPDAGEMIFAATAIKLLDILGFAPELAACVRCRRSLSSDASFLNAGRGGLECAICRSPHSLPVTVETASALRMMRREELSVVRSLSVGARAARQISLVIECLLSGHLEDRFAALNYLKLVGATAAAVKS